MNSEILQQQNNAYWIPITPEKPHSSLTNDITSNVTPTTTRISGRNLPSGSSYPETLGSVNGATLAGANQFGFRHDATASIDHVPHPDVEQNSKNKRRKLGIGKDLNRKPGEKRKNKYFWAKIDNKKVQTPKPKTPKPVTPKPQTPKTPKPKTPKPITKKDVKKDKEEGGKVVPEHIRPESETETETVLNCKRALDFDINIANLEDEAGKVIESQIPDVTEQVSNSNVVEKAECVEKASASKNDHSCDGKKRQEGLRVYGRRHSCKCLSESRKIGPNFAYSLKKKRKGRKKKFIDKIKLDFSFIIEDNKNLLLPAKLKIVDESFGCILSLLSSQMKFKQGKRLMKRFPLARNVSKQTSIVHDGQIVSKQMSIVDDGQSVSKQTSIVIDGQSVLKQTSIVNDGQSVSQGQIHERSLLSALCSTPKSTTNVAKEKKTRALYKRKETRKAPESKTKEAKEKGTRGPYKRKDKHKACFVELQKWDGKSVEQIMDSLVEYYESMNIYDDPKSIELSIMVREGNHGGDGIQKPDEEDAEFREEKAFIEAKMDRFYFLMTQLQGPKDYVKWNGSVLDSVVGVFLTQNVTDVLSGSAYMELASQYPIKQRTNEDEDSGGDVSVSSSQESTDSSNVKGPIIEYPNDEEEANPTEADQEESWKKEYDSAMKEMLASLPSFKGKEKKGEGAESFDWDSIRLQFLGKSTERTPETQDSVDWEAVRKAPIKDIAKAIEKRGQHTIIGKKIQRMLNRLVEKHGTMDLEWLREAPFEIAKAYLLSFYGLGLKSVECLRLLTLGHDAFPVDVNIARIAVRLGWVPLSKLPDEIPFHLIDKYKIHYQAITFGKVFCMKNNPNCRACPFKNECKYYQSLVESEKMKTLCLPWVKSKKSSKKMIKNIPNPFDIKRECSKSQLIMSSTYDSSLYKPLHFPMLHCNLDSDVRRTAQSPIVEFPSSPKNVEESELPDIEDIFKNNADEVNDEFIVVDIGTCKHTSSNQLVKATMSPNLSSRALVSVPQDDYIPLPKQVIQVRLRTEHQVYELPYNHPLLQNFERQIGNIPYLLAIWTQVLGTILIPVRTAMRESFPLNGTYFQINEVFADDETTQCPIKVPTSLIWMLEKRTLYCGSSTSAIFRGLLVKEIQRCCWEGYICTRGFNRQTRAPKPLSPKFHNRSQVKGKLQQEDEEDYI
uniref:HhH-GPD domain-containing protein n=1 Tax=Chenopodium quinoa TaxID=63459 RepID=A0A803M665_CHEQI